MRFKGSSFLKTCKQTAEKCKQIFEYWKKLPPLKRILALPKYGQKCTVSEPQPFTFMILNFFLKKTLTFTAKKSDRKMSIPMLFLSSFGLMRGLMKAGNTPDHARAARIVLKDFVQGK